MSKKSHRVLNLLLTQENVVVVYSENVVNVVRKNVVDESGSDPKNVVDLSENVVKTNQKQSPYPSENVVGGGIKQQWAAVKAARSMLREKPLSFVMAWLYNEARTYFQSQT